MPENKTFYLNVNSDTGYLDNYPDAAKVIITPEKAAQIRALAKVVAENDSNYIVKTDYTPDFYDEDKGEVEEYDRLLAEGEKEEDLNPPEMASVDLMVMRVHEDRVNWHAYLRHGGGETGFLTESISLEELDV